MKEQREYLAHSKNGVETWYAPVGSHATTHFADTPELKLLVTQVIERSELNGERVEFHYDFGKSVGKSDLVQTRPGDEIVYAKRLNRTEFTVFNKSRGPEDCSLVTVSLDRQDDGTYKLFSAWVGPSDSPSFPGTERETPQSKAYWTSHALAWGTQAIQQGTETSTCPW